MIGKEKEAAMDKTLVESVNMKRGVGLLGGISFIMGSVIGSGIFISPKGILQNTQSVAASLLIWIFCGFYAIIGALCYFELGSMIGKSGGQYIYLREGLGDFVAFLSAWSNLLIIQPAGTAVIIMTFANYFMAPIFDDCGPPFEILLLVGIAALVTMGVTNCLSAALGTNVSIFFSAIKSSVLVVIIVGGIVVMAQGNVENLNKGFEGSSTDAAAYALAFYSGQWAYAGWDNLNYLIEELKNPKRNLVLALFISLPCITFLYVLANVSYFALLPIPEFLASSAVAVSWGNAVLGRFGLIIPIGVACSTYGAAHVGLVVVSRLVYSASREGHAPVILSYVNTRRLTPIPSLVYIVASSFVFMLIADVNQLINALGFTSQLIQGLVMVALIRMRWTKADAPRQIRVPYVLPVFIILVTIFVALVPIITDPQIEVLGSAGLIAAGMLAYYPLVYKQWLSKYTESITIWMQLFFEAAPSKYIELKES